MVIKTLVVGTFGVNCSVFAIAGRSYAVDPGSDADVVADAMAAAGEPTAVLLTHAHFDHIGGIAGLQKRYPDLKVVVAAADVSAFGHPMNSYPPDYPLAPKPANIVNAIEIPGMEIIATPGHTPGGVSYYFAAEKLLFSGDTLFCGSVGRTDLPGGDMATLMKSLAKIRSLPPDTKVIAGHGAATTIAMEISTNPFLR